LDWTQWGFLLPGCISIDSSKCGVFSQYIPFPLFVSPPTHNSDGRAHQPPLVA
jgi:hypothetical protein